MCITESLCYAAGHNMVNQLHFNLKFFLNPVPFKAEDTQQLHH